MSLSVTSYGQNWAKLLCRNEFDAELTILGKNRSRLTVTCYSLSQKAITQRRNSQLYFAHSGWHLIVVVAMPKLQHHKIPNLYPKVATTFFIMHFEQAI